jgi:hypothetical protein
MAPLRMRFPLARRDAVSLKLDGVGRGCRVVWSRESGDTVRIAYGHNVKTTSKRIVNERLSSIVMESPRDGRNIGHVA